LLGSGTTFWSNNTTTALALIAIKEARLSNTAYGNLTNAAEYMINSSHASDFCWPDGGCNITDTAMILTALYKVGTTPGNDSAFNWLMDAQLAADGSWYKNMTATAWSLIAMSIAEKTGNRTKVNAITYIQNNQSMEGYFGSEADVRDTALAVIALKKAGASETWTVNPNNNTTSYEQYAGSLDRALYWLANKQYTLGGWGASSSDPVTTSMGVLTFGVTATMNGTITGAGAAHGSTIPNAVVTFNSTYVAYADSNGVFSINVPAGTYSISVTQENYTTNTTNSAYVVGSGSNQTLNISMIPNISINGSFAYLGSGSLRTVVSDADSNVTAAASFNVNGTAYYKNNNSGVHNGTMYLSSDPTGISVTSFNLTTADGNFFKTTTSASPESSTNYTLYLWVNDSHGSNGSSALTTGESEWIFVYIPPADGGDTNLVSSGGGGGGEASDFGLAITMYDKNLVLAQGESKTTEVTVKNTGVMPLEDVFLKVIGINSNWYTAKVSGTDAETEDLSVDEAVNFKIAWKIPSNAEAKSYSGTWRAKDKNAYAIAEKAMNLTITQIWNNTSVSDLKIDLDQLNANLTSLWNQIQELKAKGKNTSAVEAEFAAFNQTVQNAVSNYNAGDYNSAETGIDNAQILLTNLANSLTSLSKKGGLGLGISFDEVSPGNIGIFVILIAIGAVAGFFLWYKMFRVLSIAEIKKNPKMHSEGARIEGIVKSITDTRKGKVFLVADHTDKLHVRYPYYTTTEKGDMIRVTGPVKTYKDVPYMDAADLHRVSVKHKMFKLK
jgi:hypothetical protein